VSQWTVKCLWHDRVSCLLLEVFQESQR
jgi:hypothetical protein